MKHNLIHVDIEQYKSPMQNTIDWGNISEEVKAYIAHEYKRGYYDSQRRLAEDLKKFSAQE